MHCYFHLKHFFQNDSDSWWPVNRAFVEQCAGLFGFCKNIYYSLDENLTPNQNMLALVWRTNGIKNNKHTMKNAISFGSGARALSAIRLRRSTIIQSWQISLCNLHTHTHRKKRTTNGQHFLICNETNKWTECIEYFGISVRNDDIQFCTYFVAPTHSGSLDKWM